MSSTITALDVEFVTDAQFARIAETVLTRPSDTGCDDGRLWRTHGLVISWAEDGDDLVDESNYLTLRDFLAGVAGEDDNADDPDETVIDAPFGHFVYNHIRHLFVQVYDDAGRYTTTFTYAAAAILALENHAFFDEDDYDRRELERFDVNVREGFAARGRQHADSETDRTAIEDLLSSQDPEFDVYGLLGANGTISDEDRFDEMYESARDTYFTHLADPYLAARTAAFYAGTLDQVPGQGLLFALAQPATL